MDRITLRAEGRVLQVEHKAGVSAAGNNYAFDEVSVLVGKAEIWTLTLNDGIAVPKEGDHVDYSVAVSAMGGRFPRLQFRALSVIAPAALKATA